MKMTQKRWIAAVVAAAALVALTFVLVRNLGHAKPDDCATVHELNRYNKQFQDGVADPSHGPTDVGEYKTWAGELHRYAGQISDEQLRTKADAVTGLADEYVALIPRLQADLPADSDTQLPSSLPWQEGDRIGRQFHDAVVALAEACPS